MDSWIMGLLYELIVPGSWPFGGRRISLIGVSHRWNVWQEFCGGKTRGGRYDGSIWENGNSRSCSSISQKPNRAGGGKRPGAIIGLWIFFYCRTFFYLFPLRIFPLLPPICHLPEDLHPGIECTPRATQQNKSITHSITGTARPAGSALEKQEGRTRGDCKDLACQRSVWLNLAGRLEY